MPSLGMAALEPQLLSLELPLLLLPCAKGEGRYPPLRLAGRYKRKLTKPPRHRASAPQPTNTRKGSTRPAERNSCEHSFLESASRHAASRCHRQSGTSQRLCYG